jgi:hypothetical protein
MPRWIVLRSSASLLSDAQKRWFYRLLDVLGERFPHIEFESCSSGGGRIDYEVLTLRVGGGFTVVPGLHQLAVHVPFHVVNRMLTQQPD